MNEWKSQQMAFPFWRLYWNKSGRARVVYNRTSKLEPNKIILIPPNTPFSTDIEDSQVAPDQPYSLKGGRIENREMEESLALEGTVLHLFIHFTLGYPFDTISPDVFVFDLQASQETLIKGTNRRRANQDVRHLSIRN